MRVDYQVIQVVVLNGMIYQEITIREHYKIHQYIAHQIQVHYHLQGLNIQHLVHPLIFQSEIAPTQLVFGLMRIVQGLEDLLDGELQLRTKRTH